MSIWNYRMKSTILFGTFIAFALALGQSHIRISSTLTGYQLGTLKTKESELLVRRSQLQMQLARLTTKGHLNLITNDVFARTSKKETVASK